jgi:hypothetical protein
MRIEPLRSAEPEQVTDEQRAELDMLPEGSTSTSRRPGCEKWPRREWRPGHCPEPLLDRWGSPAPEPEGYRLILSTRYWP